MIGGDAFYMAEGVSKVVAVIEAAGKGNVRNGPVRFTVLSGDDSLTLPMLSVGAQGVISVASNVIPRAMSEMVGLALGGDFVKARAYHERYYPLFRDLFRDTNPIPVKAALGMMGKIRPVYRLPLCPPDEACAAALRATLAALGLIPA